MLDNNSREQRKIMCIHITPHKNQYSLQPQKLENCSGSTVDCMALTIKGKGFILFHAKVFGFHYSRFFCFCFNPYIVVRATPL